MLSKRARRYTSAGALLWMLASCGSDPHNYRITEAGGALAWLKDARAKKPIPEPEVDLFENAMMRAVEFGPGTPQDNLNRFGIGRTVGEIIETERKAPPIIHSASTRNPPTK